MTHRPRSDERRSVSLASVGASNAGATCPTSGSAVNRFGPGGPRRWSLTSDRVAAGRLGRGAEGRIGVAGVATLALLRREARIARRMDEPGQAVALENGDGGLRRVDRLTTYRAHRRGGIGKVSL